MGDVKTLEELDCIERCNQWLKAFATSKSALIIDTHYLILGEYRRRIAKGRYGEQLLNQLESRARTRLIEVSIQLDPEGYPIVPETLSKFDRSDRKFVALALKCTPIPPIVNAVDTDWMESHRILKELHIIVQELCLQYIQLKVP